MTGEDSRPIIGISVALGLGANLGAPLLNLQRALTALAAGSFSNQRVSSVYLTVPVDCVPGTPDFYNATVTGLWSGTPEQLRELCHGIEHSLGRPATHAQDEARMIDLDILLFGSLWLPGQKSDASTVTSPHCSPLRIPHPRLLDRAFVLLPLNDLAADWQIPPEGLTVREALSRLRHTAPADLTSCRKTTATLLPC